MASSYVFDSRFLPSTIIVGYVRNGRFAAYRADIEDWVFGTFEVEVEERMLKTCFGISIRWAVGIYTVLPVGYAITSKSAVCELSRLQPWSRLPGAQRGPQK